MGHAKVVVMFVIVAVISVHAGLAFVIQEDSSMRERILSSDFNTASQALNENRRNKKAQLVRLSLEHPSLIIKRQAAEALMELDDKSSVQKPRYFKGRQ
jgi:hypothetical protein